MSANNLAELIEVIRPQFELDWRGIHGAPHWARVRINGRRLARETGANPRVIDYFAFLHDSRRLHDGFDSEHGQRAARFAQELRDRHLPLDDDEFRLLEIACREHSHGTLNGDITVMTCWDADRLDLGRVGIRPDPERLCTAAARKPTTIEWAYKRSLQGIMLRERR